jgi:hypothetical protein
MDSDTVIICQYQWTDSDTVIICQYQWIDSDTVIICQYDSKTSLVWFFGSTHLYEIAAYIPIVFYNLCTVIYVRDV